MLSILIAGSSALGTAAARPAVFEEVARIANPDPSYELTNAMALDGSDLLVCAFRPSHEPDEYSSVGVLLHFERQADRSWSFRGELVAARQPREPGDDCTVALKGGLGAVSTTGFSSNGSILERTATGWTISRPAVTSRVSDVAVHGRTVAFGASRAGQAVVYLLEKNAQGTWVAVNTLEGKTGCCDVDFPGPDTEFASDEVTAGYWHEDWTTPEPTYSYLTDVFDRVSGAWQRTETLDSVSAFDTAVLDGSIALRFQDWAVPGDIASLFTRDANGNWLNRHSLLTEEWFANKRTSRPVIAGDGSGALAYAGAPHDDGRGLDAGSVTVLTRTDASSPHGTFQHVATLFASDAAAGARLGTAIAGNGHRVAALAPGVAGTSGTGAIYIFELPISMPAGVRHQDTFEDLSAIDWMPWGSTDWRVVASGGSNVLRQTNTQGDARAIFEGFEGAAQSIQADMKVNSKADATRSWAGLIVRYTDPLNYYYVLNGGTTNTLQIRKIVNGAFSQIASAPFTLQTGRTYRIRLEAIGTRLRAYVDDRLLVEARDVTHARGRAGLAMWKANTEYDNVVVSSAPRAVLHADSFSGNADEQATPSWIASPASYWTRTFVNGATVYRQNVAEGDARAVHGAPTEDQIISADVKPLGFHPSTTGGGFVGLMARYVDDRNYYYAYLGRTGTVSLRRLTNGQITVIDQASIGVTLGASYRLRFEAIGSALRVYVNGRLVVEGEDSAIERGRYGLVTYRGSADYDSFEVLRP